MSLREHVKKLREFTVEELRTKLVDAKEELFNLRFQGATGSLNDPSQIRRVKREIARLHTVVREKELGLETAAAGKKEA